MSAGLPRTARAVLGLGLAAALGGVVASGATAAPEGARLLDDFESAKPWSALPADGVRLGVTTDDGLHGKSLRLDFDFGKGGGYAVVRRTLSLDLPANYRFHLSLRGQTGPQNFEFKLVDSTDTNVWWVNRRDFAFPTGWDSIAIRKRQIEFAWGPAGGGEIRHVAALEISVTAGSGGVGTVWLDDLWLEPLPPPRDVPLPVVASSSSQTASPGNRSLSAEVPQVAWRVGGAALAVDGDTATAWESAKSDRDPALTLDLGELREFGGLIVDWAPAGRGPDSFVVELSLDGVSWHAVAELHSSRRRDFVYLPESDARYVRLGRVGGKRSQGGPISVLEVTIQALAWSATKNAFLQAVARAQPHGSYPRGMSGEMVYWTLVGLDGGPEVLLSEDGMLETSPRGFSIEPFLRVDGRLLTWSNFKAEQRLEGGDLPIPNVILRADSLELRVQALALREGDGRDYLRVAYTVRSRRVLPAEIELDLALRPFQVNPPFQFLGRPAGFSPIRSIARRGTGIVVNDSSVVWLWSPPDRFHAAAWAEGEVTDYLRSPAGASRDSVRDKEGLAWGVATYERTLPAGDQITVWMTTPILGSIFQGPLVVITDELVASLGPFEQALEGWRSRLGQPAIEGPPSAREALETMRAQIGFVLVNRDGPAIQPGSRAYDRTWIRDGSLTCTALLRLGYDAEVREFLEWFAPYQYENGKVPCCVDERGADPVPEHDSTGEFLYLVAEYYRYTGDLDLVRRFWPRLAAGAAYLDSLRQTRRTAEWSTPENAPFFGLLPPSISHEGYSAKPMHSYWDDFFALRGFRDAAYLAEALGDSEEARRVSRVAAEFESDLAASLRAVQRVRGIDFVPGAADLGDFDATSTTIVLSPVQAESVPPAGALERTFERYYEFFVRRRGGREEWDAFTPYEMRNIGAFIRLGWRERAAELVDYFLRYRRPAGWRQWAEVVWHDERKPAFIGDMPHTWVGTDYVRSLLDAFAYERDRDRSLVVAAGLPRAWTQEKPGVTVNGLHTPFGPLHYTLREEGGSVAAQIESGLRLPPGGLRLVAPGVTAKSRATVNGRGTRVESDGAVVVRELPATVRIHL